MENFLLTTEIREQAIFEPCMFWHFYSTIFFGLGGWFLPGIYWLRQLLTWEIMKQVDLQKSKQNKQPTTPLLNHSNNISEIKNRNALLGSANKIHRALTSFKVVVWASWPCIQANTSDCKLMLSASRKHCFLWFFYSHRCYCFTILVHSRQFQFCCLICKCVADHIMTRNTTTV